MGKRAKLFLRTICITSVLTGTYAQANNVTPQGWLETRIEENALLDMQVDNHQMSFDGERQTHYAVSLSRQLNQNWQFEAIAYYRRGALDFGTLTQTVKTRSYELVAWREFEDLRVGVTHAAQPQHQIALTVGEDVNLPTSETLGVYVDMELGSTIEQAVRLAVLRETWSAANTPLPVGWLQSRDSQLHVRYSLTF